MSVSPEDQVAYLNAIHVQLGPRLVFWINTLPNDFNLYSYAEQMKKDARAPQDALSLGLRNFDGSPKPALEIWMGFENVSMGNLDEQLFSIIVSWIAPSIV